MQLIARIPAALVMVSVPMAPAFAKKAGRDPIAPPWIKMPCNVCLTALAMAHLIWTHRPAPANLNGAVMIAPRSYAIWTVVCMDAVLAMPVPAMMAGVQNTAIQSYVMHAAMSMVNAKMALVFVSLAGMANIAPLKAVRILARHMVNAALAAKVNGNVAAMRAGMVLIVA